jgi:hypothetical protein
MAMGPRRVVTDVLMMTALKFCQPVAVLIHVKINDLLHRPCYFYLHRFHVFLFSVGAGQGWRSIRAGTIDQPT